jgi:anti-sigma B factor antagonist
VRWTTLECWPYVSLQHALKLLVSWLPRTPSRRMALARRRVRIAAKSCVRTPRLAGPTSRRMRPVKRLDLGMAEPDAAPVMSLLAARCALTAHLRPTYALATVDGAGTVGLLARYGHTTEMGIELRWLFGLSKQRFEFRGRAMPQDATRSGITLTVSVEDRGGTRVVSPSGEIDIGTVAMVARPLLSGLSNRFERVVLNLRETTFIDSSGLAVIVEATEHARRREIPFAVMPGGSVLGRVFDVYGYTALVPFASPEWQPTGH